MKRICISTAARLFGDMPALRYESKVYSFRELATECDRLIPKMTQSPTDRILAIRATNSPDTVIALLAAFRCKRTFTLMHPGSKDEIPLPPLDKGISVSNASHCILFTSGSSAAPKGVVLTESALIASAKASEANLGWQDDDQWILNLPMAHIGGLSILVRCFLAGKCVNLQPRFSSSRVYDAISQEGATMISLVPTTLMRLMTSERKHLLKKLRVILLGGAAIPSQLRQQWRQQQLCVLESYGMTETSSQVATSSFAAAAAFKYSGMMPLKGIKVTIEDTEGKALPPNSHGRIRVSGPTVMVGYLNKPPSLGTFLTGDLGYIDSQGSLHVTGRSDNIIITGGENVSPAGVEEKLKQIVGIEEAVVFGLPDSEFGQIVAAVLGVNEKTFAKSELTDVLSESFSTHEKPRRIYAAPIDSLPLLDNGKIDRRRVISMSSSLKEIPFFKAGFGDL